MTIYGKSLQTMQRQIFEVNTGNGWFDADRTFGDNIALLHSEVSEAYEAFRAHDFTDQTTSLPIEWNGTQCTPCTPYLPKPEGVGSELADILIRLLDTCERTGIDLEAEYNRKLEYNKTRGYRHGGKRV